MDIYTKLALFATVAIPALALAFTAWVWLALATALQGALQ